MANFIKQYISPSGVRRIIKILKVGNFYFLVGYRNFDAIIIKISSSGSHIWSKMYDFDELGSQPPGFKNILDCDDGLIASYGSGHDFAGLCKIDYDGNLIWFKRIFDSNNYPIPANYLDATSVSTNFFQGSNPNTIVLSCVQRVRKTEVQSHYRRLFFYEINQSGTILNSGRIDNENYFFYNTEKIENSYFSTGFFTSFSDFASHRFLFKIDANFNAVSKYYLTDSDNKIIDTRIISNGKNSKFVIAGNYDTDNLYLCVINAVNLEVEKFKIFNRYSNTIRSVQISNDSVYLRLSSSTGLIKFDLNLNFQWNKKFNNTGGVRSFLTEDEIHTIIVNGLAITNLSYDSCETINNSSDFPMTEINGIIFKSAGTEDLLSSPETSINLNLTISTLETTTNIICESDEAELDLNNSTITANPTSILTGGGAQGESEIEVKLYDTDGSLINSDAYVVEIIRLNNTGTLTQTSFDNGIYSATLNSSSIEETAILGFTVDNSDPSINEATVDFVELGEIIKVTNNTSLQSPQLYLQATGSKGIESTKGRHLRWALRGVLGEKHLPKGDNATSQANFNKPNDYIKIYKAAYRKKIVSLNFVQNQPEVVDSANFLWIYLVEDKEFYLRFGNASKYNEVANIYNPLSQSLQFLVAYGSNLIEIENIKDLFFAVSVRFVQNIQETLEVPSFRVETLSVESNTITSNKVVSNRRHLTGNSLNSSVRLLCENGRSIRGIVSNKNIASIDFEFYGDTIQEINTTTGWDVVGDYALTLKDSVALKQLEPSPGDVHGIWQRFNDDAYVNIENYEEKWNSQPAQGDRNIKEVVQNYITLSDDSNNPLAIENIPLGNTLSDPNDNFEISNLDLLHLAANDYHIARLLGLGILDIDAALEFTVNTKEGEQKKLAEKKHNYVYIAEYYTNADLEDGLGKRDVHHLYMSLPTSNNDDRLPIPVNLSQIIPGVFIGGLNGELSPLTDVDGYAHDGLSRYISLYAGDIPENDTNTPFFITSEEVSLSKITTPVFGGLEHNIDNAPWQKPELSNDSSYLNAVPDNEQPHFETRFILMPEPQKPYYVHQQTNNGMHTYNAYGINWFSRATSSGTNISINTLLTPANPLKAPINTSSHLIRQESPLFLTSQSEQDRLGEISGDKTLIRLFFNYHSFQELKDYKVPLNSTLSSQEILNNSAAIYPDTEEIFAEQVELFFRNEIPNNVRGKILAVEDHNSIEILSIVQTGDYYIPSTDETIIPEIIPGTEENYIGGVFNVGDNRFIIHEISQGELGPKITVYKKQVSDSITGGGNPINQDGYLIDLPITDNEFPNTQDGIELLAPFIEGDGYFMAIENMQSVDTWGNPNPNSFNVNVGVNNIIKREVIELTDDDGEVERRLEKSRGIWENAKIDSIDIDGNIITSNHIGLYKIEFVGFQLNEHPQFDSNGKSVEYYQGIIRVLTEQALQGNTIVKKRKTLPVLKIKNIIRPSDNGAAQDLILIVEDPNFSSNPNYDTIQTGTNLSVNFYPGYKVYLYKDVNFGLTEDSLLPEEGEGMRYSVFGFRSLDIDDNYVSKISTPCLMFAQEIIQAIPPEQPLGPLVATRPDYFGRSTYTLTTKYAHKPHGVLFYRSNDEALLNALYEKSTVLQIREQLKLLGGTNEEYVSNRWANFLDFETLQSDGDFKVYPPIEVSEEGYKFPNPDKRGLFEWANNVIQNLNNNTAFPQNPILPLFSPSDFGNFSVGDSRIFEFVKGYIYNAFVPLTRVPILYQYLNGSDYQPIDKEQVIIDGNGHTLPPIDPKDSSLEPNGFDMAPMMKIIGDAPDENEPHETLFTDFKLDGTSNNLYFYGAKEVSTQMKMSAFSPFLGPIKLVNTNPPEAPSIKRIIPVLKNEILGIQPEICIEVNSYPEVQKIKKLNIYRANNKEDALSIRSMTLVKVIDLEIDNLLGEPIWVVKDDFNDLNEIPFNDPLFYRITASREVVYTDSDGNEITEYAPSQASKIVASIMVETTNPDSPILMYSYDVDNSNEIQLTNVILEWNKMTHNGKYHVYKMNNQGNWVKIESIVSNSDSIQILLSDFSIQYGTLSIINTEGNPLYHHFKVISENSAGMLSTQENILTIPNTSTSNQDTPLGIGVIEIGSTFTIN